jgi:prolyl oligopeptidase
VLDMLRFHLFTIGRAWSVDYGNSEVNAEFNCLIKYSPLHNVTKKSYPATLILTGDHDDRVVPAHSFKFAATLQEKNDGPNPMLIRIDVNAGHGAGKPTSKQIDEYSDMWGFIFYNLKMEL